MTSYRNPEDTRVTAEQLTRLERLRDKVVGHGLQVALRALELELTIAEAAANAKESNEAFELKTAGLQIGCGTHRIEEWTNFDIFPGYADIVGDAREGLPFPDDTFDNVFSEHMMEHVDYPHSVTTVLGEMNRVLAPGGKLIVGVPDSEPVIRAYAEGDTEFMEKLKEEWYGRRPNLDAYDQPIDMVHLVGADEFDSPKYAPHFWSYDHAKMTSLLEKAGFSDIKPWEFDESMANPDRAWNSVYLEAIKPVTE